MRHMLQGRLLPGLREVHRSSLQSPNLQGHIIASFQLGSVGLRGPWRPMRAINCTDHHQSRCLHWLQLPDDPQVGYRI